MYGRKARESRRRLAAGGEGKTSLRGYAQMCSSL
jgi:hypothetical protein